MEKFMEKSAQIGVGLNGLLFITFLVLKLTQVIDWSWWWVTAPLWIPLALGIVVLVFSVVRLVKIVKDNNKKYNR